MLEQSRQSRDNQKVVKEEILKCWRSSVGRAVPTSRDNQQVVKEEILKCWRSSDVRAVPTKSG